MFYKTRKNLKSQKTDTKTILPCGMELSQSRLSCIYLRVKRTICSEYLGLILNPFDLISLIRQLSMSLKTISSSGKDGDNKFCC